MLGDRDGVAEDEGGHRRRMVESEPQRGLAAPIAADHRERLVAEQPHQRDTVGGGAFGVRAVVVGGLGFAGPPVAAHVGADDGVPGGGRARMSVQEQDGRPLAAVPHAQDDVADVDVVERASPANTSGLLAGEVTVSRYPGKRWFSPACRRVG